MPQLEEMEEGMDQREELFSPKAKTIFGKVNFSCLLSMQVCDESLHWEELRVWVRSLQCLNNTHLSHLQ